MRKVITVISLCMGLLSPHIARGDVIPLSDRVIDTHTQLVWLNVWEGDPLVNPHRLADVAGGWRHANGGQLTGFFFGQFGVPPVPFVSGPYHQQVVDLMLTLGGTTQTRSFRTPTGQGVVTGYTITGWYESDFPGVPAPSFDEAFLEYFPDPSGSSESWYGHAISTIGSWTSLDNHPHPITFPQAHFLISSLVPEPPVVALLALGLAMLGSRARAR